MSDEELSLARKAFHRRLVSTPGVICSLNDEQVDCSLYIVGKIYKVNDATEQNFETLRDLWETPDGWALSEAVDVWRHARELALGFHYVRVDGKKYDEWRAEIRRSGVSKLEHTERRTSSASASTTGSGVLSAIRERRRTTSSGVGTALGSMNTSLSAPSTMAHAISASDEEVGSASITTTRPGAYEDFSACLATEQSEFSETTSPEYRRLFDTFLESARPPDEWLAPRRAWAKFVREILSRSKHVDSEKQVATACELGQIDDTAYRDWLRVRDTFQPRTIAVWHDSAALEICAAWLKKEKGICWTDHTFFGRELSKRTGLPYFGQNGLDKDGRSILDAKGPIIASGAANDTGKNLQAWRANLITSCPTGAAVWEQRLGRTHRQGQRADEVTVDVLVGCIEHVEAWERAVAEAKMAADMFGAPQKVLLADVDMPSVEHVSRLAGARWRKSTNTT